MDNPINAVKSGLTFKNVILATVGIFVAALILDVLGATKWLLTPYSAAREAWNKSKGAAGAVLALAVPAALAIGNATMGAFAIGA